MGHYIYLLTGTPVFIGKYLMGLLQQINGTTWVLRWVGLA
jgi:hypothetical protein